MYRQIVLRVHPDKHGAQQQEWATHCFRVANERFEYMEEFFKSKRVFYHDTASAEERTANKAKAKARRVGVFCIVEVFYIVL